jgi:hypothetical protein
LVSWIFLRLLGAIYVAAFASLGVQIVGLIGQRGILPVEDYLAAAHRTLGYSAYRVLPTVFWVNSGDTALVAGTVAGALLGLLVFVDKWTRTALVGLFVLYLSYVYAGQDFMSFQWDTLLLETGFLAIFLPGGSRIIVWLFRWLVFRYLFLAGIVKLLSGDATWRGLTARAVSPLFIVNPYGLFAVMTTTRPEIVIEGSADGRVWREYVFRYKPGPLSRPAAWNIPHQPRLDWQMWFAALGGPRENLWIVGLMRRLLEGSPPVLALLDTNPFAEGPPKFVRAKLYDYRFADRGTHAATGQWWVRRIEGLYFPEISLADFR